MWLRTIKDLITFSPSERRGIVILSVLLFASVAVPATVSFFRRNYTNHYQELRLRVDSLSTLVPTATRHTQKTTFERTDRTAQVFAFDPNTISQDSLVLLGFSAKQAAAIINYRSHGKFRSAEQFLRLNVVSQHQHLAGYVRVAGQHSPTKILPAATDSLSTKKIVQPPPSVVDINTADTALLKTLPGIGSYFARQIVEYRRKLGGYTKLEQLCEIKYFTHEKLSYLKNRLTIDYSKVRRIPLTIDSVAALRYHPYAGAYAARGIAQYIKHSGGSATTLSALVANNILSAEQAEKLHDYIAE